MNLWARSRVRSAPGSVGSERRNRGDYLLCRDDTAGVVRHIDVERSVHHLIRVIRDRVSHHRDVVAKLGRVADGGFDAGMGGTSPMTSPGR